MGVNGLWQVLHPCARPTNLAQLNRKRLAVDASIWIYQFLKAVRDKEGHALRSSHIVGFFRRICKLLWHGILPVFVFDGGAPLLKRQTIQGRKQRRQGRREDAARTAGRLLALQMQRAAEREVDETRRQREGRKLGQEGGGGGVEAREAAEAEAIPDAADLVYADEVGMSARERDRSRKFRKEDAYHLPDLGEGGIAGGARPDDPRILTPAQLEEYAREFDTGENVNLYDFSNIDFDGDFFQSLPPTDRYNIINAARLRSRLRMGLSKEQLDVMFPDRMAFSRFQIERVRERNHLTQRLMKETGMAGTDLTVSGGRIAGERDREYVLVKNDGAEGGWALGVINKDADAGKKEKPIDVDAVEFTLQDKDDDEEEEDDFEDVPIQGLNRLPKLTPAQQIAAQRQEYYESRRREREAAAVEQDSLFVAGHGATDEDDDITRAIAMSLETQYGVRPDAEPEIPDDQEAPQWTQRAADDPRPVHTPDGRIAAHILNNRANAAFARPATTGDESDGDSDGDLQKALAASRKAKKSQPKPAPPASFDGPLPFPKLDWDSSLAKKPAPECVSGPGSTSAPLPVDLFDDDDDMAGGFEVLADDKPKARPLPPWLVDDDVDIRDKLRLAREAESKAAAADRAQAEAEAAVWTQQKKENDIIEIESDDDEKDSAMRSLDGPPRQPARAQSVHAQEPQKEEMEVDTMEPSQETQQHQGSKSLASLCTTETDGHQNQTAQAARDDGHLDDGHLDVDDGHLDEDDGHLDEDGEEFEGVPMLVPPAATAREPPPAAATMPHHGGLSEDMLEAAVVELPPDPDDDFSDDFSDPEDAELLEQMVREVEEHARFAGELNNRVEDAGLREAAFEAELRALRGQQKKDRRDADDVSQVMVTECQSLLRLFGIPYITAPMEAEAQCAELVRLGLVDGIVTDDSDTFLFGGTRVYKNMFNSNKYVECYLASEIEKELSLARDRLISLALLLGSDYTDGLAGVGPVSAVEILSEFSGLAEFRDWVADVQTHQRPKEADAASPFRRKFRRSQTPRLVLPNGFPSPAVRDAYLRPDVDSDPQPFQWGVPDVEGLRLFLMATVGWDRDRTDEILVPVVRDMNRREREGTQTNITRFFAGSVGAGARAGAEGSSLLERVKKAGGSRRMASAVERMRAGDRGHVQTEAGKETEGRGGGATGKRKRAAVGAAARKRKAT